MSPPPLWAAHSGKDPQEANLLEYCFLLLPPPALSSRSSCVPWGSQDPILTPSPGFEALPNLASVPAQALA